MIKIKIGANEDNYNRINSNWIIQQIERRRRDKQPYCVEIFISKGSVNIVFATPGKRSSVGALRSLTFEERVIEKLWKKFNLDKTDFAIPDLLSFLISIENFA